MLLAMLYNGVPRRFLRIKFCKICFPLPHSSCTVQSQDPTPNCTVTVPLTAPITIVPPGDACISCVFNNTLATDAVFNGIQMNPDSVQVEGGVLMVYDTEVTFGGAESGTGSTSTAFSLSCTDGIDNITAAVFVESRFITKTASL